MPACTETAPANEEVTQPTEMVRQETVTAELPAPSEIPSSNTVEPTVTEEASATTCEHAVMPCEAPIENATLAPTCAEVLETPCPSK